MKDEAFCAALASSREINHSLERRLCQADEMIERLRNVCIDLLYEYEGFGYVVSKSLIAEARLVLGMSPDEELNPR